MKIHASEDVASCAGQNVNILTNSGRRKLTNAGARGIHGSTSSTAEGYAFVRPMRLPAGSVNCAIVVSVPGISDGGITVLPPSDSIL